MEPHPINYKYPMKFPKINTLWKRDMTRTVKRKGVIIPRLYSEEAFRTIKFWNVSEKIDGENTRIHIDFNPNNELPPHVSIYSRNDTDTPEINEDLLSYIRTHLTEDALKRAFTKGSFSTGECPRHVMIFGEGFGLGIRSGGNYKDSPELIVFDIVIDDWFLEHKNVADISKKLDLESVPILSLNRSVEEIVDYVKEQPYSLVANKPHRMEGIVATSSPLLLTRKGYPLRFKLKTKDFRDLDSISAIEHQKAIINGH